MKLQVGKYYKLVDVAGYGASATKNNMMTPYLIKGFKLTGVDVDDSSAMTSIEFPTEEETQAFDEVLNYINYSVIATSKETQYFEEIPDVVVNDISLTALFKGGYIVRLVHTGREFNRCFTNQEDFDKFVIDYNKVSAYEKEFAELRVRQEKELDELKAKYEV